MTSKLSFTFSVTKFYVIDWFGKGQSKWKSNEVHNQHFSIVLVICIRYTEKNIRRRKNMLLTLFCRHFCRKSKPRYIWQPLPDRSRSARCWSTSGPASMPPTTTVRSRSTWPLSPTRPRLSRPCSSKGRTWYFYDFTLSLF